MAELCRLQALEQTIRGPTWTCEKTDFRGSHLFNSVTGLPCALLIVEIHTDKNGWQSKPKAFANNFPRVSVISNFILLNTIQTEDSTK